MAAHAEPPKNALSNPGFELVEGDELSNWRTPEYWSGSVGPVAEKGTARSGKRAARLSSAEKLGRHWGRTLQLLRLPEITGRRFRYSMWARGSGELLLGCIEYRSPERHKPHYKYRWQPTPVELGNEWQQVVFEFSVPDPEVRKLAVVAEVRGEASEALLDDAVFVRSQDPDVSIVATPSHAMVPVGQKLDMQIKIEKNGEPLESGELIVLTIPPDQDPISTEAKISSNGVTAYTYEAPVDPAPGIHRMVIAHPESGAAVDCSIDLTDQETWDAFAKVADRAKIEPTPAHLLFIGDSLTDQQRGYNYVDKAGLLAAAIRRHKPDLPQRRRWRRLHLPWYGNANERRPQGPSSLHVRRSLPAQTNPRLLLPRTQRYQGQQHLRLYQTMR